LHITSRAVLGEGFVFFVLVLAAAVLEHGVEVGLVAHPHPLDGRNDLHVVRNVIVRIGGIFGLGDVALLDDSDAFFGSSLLLGLGAGVA